MCYGDPSASFLSHPSACSVGPCNQVAMVAGFCGHIGFCFLFFHSSKQVPGIPRMGVS